MRKILINIFSLIIVLTTLLLVSCGGPEVDENNVIKKEGLIYYQDKPFTGIVVGDYPNGKPRIRKPCKNGKIDGLYEYFYENGQHSLKEYYKDGKKDGLREVYFEDGRLYSKETYKNGKLIK